MTGIRGCDIEGTGKGGMFPFHWRFVSFEKGNECPFQNREKEPGVRVPSDPGKSFEGP